MHRSEGKEYKSSFGGAPQLYVRLTSEDTEYTD